MSKDELTALHIKVLAGSSTATARIAETLADELPRSLRHRFPTADVDDIRTASHDAILAYLKDPSKFDAERGSLLHFAKQRAEWNLLTILKRGRDLPIPTEDVELERRQDVIDHRRQKRPDFETDLIDYEGEVRMYDKLCRLLPDATDQRILALMLEGIRETERYAEILGITSEPLERQRAEVKRYKDRIKVFIQRKYER